MVWIIKVIVTIFMLVASIVLFILWLVCGTLLLIALLIRIICLYTIALLNSFVSGNPLTENYSKAIEDVINMYVETFTKILSMSKLPWQKIEEKNKVNFRSLLPNEIKELKKSWYITLIVFLSYIFSFGISLSYLIYKDNKQKNYYEKRIQDFKKEEKKSNRQKYKIIRLLLDMEWTKKSIEETTEITQHEIENLISEYDK